ncbi:tegument protein UL16 [Equid gammaherpesvirus 5]|uniref:Tegument protein UL16 n=1 Tax=Equid gammaherpesvirus 5 TaxID=10371 RepID=A0A0B4Q5N9_9GAMA|nr:tegument protein UL16 [Equid gammaherpesvirus 5]AIU39558.1 tegument protein UL16 [Equid gammaherpesvirus 5]APT43398.1 tegument protein UL16 [Equid gammaherpesvirus 5]UTK45410.1 tegument protein UL16 [Equid gammaherpesvirus 5]UTK45489.1 tegument protein UL16 [Equid gammaherpesvirus 5]UTK45568.1 tegument protein UL16 [Equid gammaherpesvirus 5]
MASGGDGGGPRDLFRKFLNKECVWKKSANSTPYFKIYVATTAVSPVFKPALGPGRPGGAHAINVTALVMKPKRRRICATFYVNGLLMEACVPEVIFTKRVPGPHGFFLLYFGPFGDPKMPFSIPAEPSVSAPQNMQLLSRMEMLDTSTHIAPGEVESAIEGKNFVTVGKCVWFDGEAFYLYYLSMEYLMCCPTMSEHTTLSRFVTLLTHCDDVKCVPCYGMKIHANVAGGYTDPGSEGCSGTCLCTLSCAALEKDLVPVVSNKSLLSLLFGPMSHQQVTHLKFSPTPKPAKLQDVLSGVTGSGDVVEVKAGAWNLLKMSTFYSRCTMYECQILKRHCLRSY